MSLTLKQLRSFLTLSETRHFGHAAARLRISQPALSLQVKEMEAVLGARLVDRLPKGVQLTRAGQALADRAPGVLAAMEDLEGAVRWQDGLSGRLRLGVIPTLAPYLLPLALTRIRAADLTLDIRVRESQTDALLSALKDGRLDAAVVALPLGDPALTALPLFTDRFVLAGSAARLAQWAATAEALRPRQIDPDQLLLLDEGHCLADQALEVCGIGGRRQVDLGASSLATLCGLVAEGFGLTLLPETAVRTEAAASPGLALMRFAAPEPSRDMALVLRAGSDGAGWAHDLAALLRGAADELLEHAAAAIPSCGPGTALDKRRGEA